MDELVDEMVNSDRQMIANLFTQLCSGDRIKTYDPSPASPNC